MSSQPETSLEGTLHKIDFQGGSLVPHIVQLYNELREEYETTDILVLKRLPTGVSELTQALGDQLDLIGVPNVQSIAHHARGVLERETDYETLAYEERIEFLAMVIDGHSWENEYFESPSDLDSFGRDIGRILMSASWQGGFSFPGDDEYDPLLKELASINQKFHDELRDRGLIERAMVVQTALETLEDPTAFETVKREYDAVIAVEFEEFNELERTYLSKLTEDADLICLGESDSSVERVWSEPGRFDSITKGLEPPSEPILDSKTNIQGTHGHVAQYLATGDEAKLLGVEEANDTFKIRERSFEEQIQTIANEIEYLRAEEEWAYGDFAVLLKDGNSPIAEVRQSLLHAGIPVASATVSGLDQDPTVREIHALAEHILTPTPETTTLLTARLGVDEETLDGLIVQVKAAGSMEEKLNTWLRATNTKHRIASNKDEITAKSQFAHVKNLRQIAVFIDDSDFLDSTWDRFISMLERTINDYAPTTRSDNLDVEEGGVLVDGVNILKNDQRKVVFLANVIEGEYPSKLSLTPLFPQQWLTKMSGYPNVTSVDKQLLCDTFGPASNREVFSLAEYYRQLARRTLAIGARSASERLYFCTYLNTDNAHSETLRASRYLEAIKERVQLPVIGEAPHTRDIYTIGNVSRLVLEQPWEQLEAVRAAASVGNNKVKLEDTEELFGAIQQLLKRDSVDEQFIDAVYRQIELARGEVGMQ